MAMNFPLALPRVSGPVFVFDDEALQQGLEASRQSPRRRIMLPMQRTDQEGVQRLVNFVQPGSYIRPHLHPMPECIENITVLRGSLGFLTFDDDGSVLGATRLVSGNPVACMVDIEQGVWHTLVSLAEDTVLLEVKRGPYNAKTDKRFADWAPAEGAPEAAAWLEDITRTHWPEVLSAVTSC